MEIKQKILTKAEEMYMRYGIKSVTMDDIAKELGISKKTLYQYVDNKTDLIEKVIQEHVRVEVEEIEKIIEESSDPIQEMLNIAQYVTQQMKNLSPTTVYDLKKYHKDCWKLMESLHQHHVYKSIKNNIERGIEQGIYRANISPDVISRLYIGSIYLIVDENLFPSRVYPRPSLIHEYITYHILGIASDEGLKLYQKYQNLD